MGFSRSLKAAILLGVSLLITMESVVGRFVVEKNSLRVTSPESIKGNHDSAIGNFGIPQYGGSMAGTVVYPKDNQKGCKEFDVSFKSKAGAMPNFLLLDRGGIRRLPNYLHLILRCADTSVSRVDHLMMTTRPDFRLLFM